MLKFQKGDKLRYINGLQEGLVVSVEERTGNMRVLLKDSGKIGYYRQPTSLWDKSLTNKDHVIQELLKGPDYVEIKIEHH